MAGGNIELTLGRASRGAPTSIDRPNLVVLVHQPVSDDTEPGVQRLDLDSVDRALASMGGTALRATILGHACTAEFTPTELESFDPGAIASHFPLLDALDTLCRDLRSPKRADDARHRLAQLLDLPPEASPAPSPSPAPVPAASDFDRLLGAAPPGPSRETETASQLIRNLVADAAELTPARDESLLKNVESVREQALREVLATPALRRLERTWRGIHWLVTGTDPQDGVRLWLVTADVTRLRGDGETPRACLNSLRKALGSHDALKEAGVGALMVDYEFASPDDFGALESLGRLAEELDTAVLAAAPGALAGFDDSTPDAALTAAWDKVRQSRAAGHIVAVQPRLLLRLPYGRRGESCDVQGFEELLAAPDHEAFLWGNPAYGTARLLCQGFERSGAWPPDPAASRELEDMPLAVYDDGTGDAIMPPAEHYLDEQDIGRLRALGIMALLSFRNRNAVQLAGFHTIAR